jgi:F420-non-reducing hydrogenase iron-sulfur subunit
LAEFEPKVVGFLCNWCSYAGADLAGVSRFQYPPNIRIVRVMCSARVEPSIIMEMFLQGADGVFVGGCHLGDCHYIKGNYFTEKRMKLVRRLLGRTGLSPQRFRLEWVSASEGARFAGLMKDFTDLIREIGPSPVSGDSPDLKDAQLLFIARNILEDFRLRALINKQLQLIEEGNVYGKKFTEEELDKILFKAMDDEFDRAMILWTSRAEPLSVKTIADMTDIPAGKVLNEIANLRKRDLIRLDRVEGQSPLYISQGFEV